MRKVILSMMVSLDGYIEGPNHEMDWSVWDEEMEDYMMNFLRETDTFIYGRRAYEVMKQYWPHVTTDPNFPDRDMEFVQRMNETPKLILSRSLTDVEWNSRIIHGDHMPQEIKTIKNQPGKNLALFAGAETASFFINHDLIDEYQIIINPVILGSGTPLFNHIRDKINVKLLKTQSFPSGIVILHYKSLRS